MDEEQMTSPQMEQIIWQLATKHGVDLAQKGARFSLDMPERKERWMMANLDGTRISVTRCVIEPDETLALELDMVFTLLEAGWEPVELVGADAVWDAYVQVAQATGIVVYDEQGELRFACFTEYWAAQLKAQGWLEQSRYVPESSGRMVGCESTTHTACYGELWHCVGCGKIVCYAEGSDNHLELCDDCWVKEYPLLEAFSRLEDDVPF